jgi:hypothetical protein
MRKPGTRRTSTTAQAQKVRPQASGRGERSACHFEPLRAICGAGDEEQVHFALLPRSDSFLVLQSYFVIWWGAAGVMGALEHGRGHLLIMVL